MTQLPLTLEQARDAGRKGMRRAQANAERHVSDFTRRAVDYMLAYLVTRGDATGEDLVDATIAAGIRPPEARAFGGPMRMLPKMPGVVVLDGNVPRRKGHGTGGGRLYGWRP